MGSPVRAPSLGWGSLWYICAVSHDAPPPSQQPPGPASSRAPSTPRPPSGPPASTGRPPSTPPPSSRGLKKPVPLVEIVGQSGPEEPPPPPPAEPERDRKPLGLLVGIGAMVLVPALILGLVLAYVPRLRPWQEGPAPGPAPTGSAEQAPPEGKVLLSGRVVDSEGEPVDGARVAAYTGSRALQAGETATNHGAYALEVDPGRLVLVAEHEKGLVASAELLLSPGAQVKNLVLALGPVRTIRGKITAESGDAVAGAALKIDGVPWLHRDAVSDADGGYRVLRVPSLEATLRVSAAGYQPTSVKLGATAAPEELLDIKLRKESDVEGQVLDPERRPLRAAVLACDGKEPGQRISTDGEGKFKLAREFARCPLVAYHDQFAPSEPTLAERGSVELRLQAGGAIAGVVVEESGGPVGSFFVGIESFVPAFGERLNMRAAEPRSFEDRGGAFLLEKLTPGNYVLSVGAEQHSLVRSTSIEVRAGQTTRGVRIVLPQGGVVEGQIFDEERRAPVASARVSFDASSSVQRQGPSAQSDESGKFRIENAPSGPFSLRVEREGYRTRILAGLRVNSGDVMKQEIGLKPSGDGGTGLQFGGIGSSLDQTREGLRFRDVFEGSPAEKAGLKAGDLLRRIDGQTIEGLSLADAIQRLRGEKGSQVRVTVERPPSGDYIDTTITRDEIVR